MKTERVDRAIYLKSGSYWVVKRNKWTGPYSTIEAARLERDRIEVEQAPKPEGGPFADFMRQYYYPHYLEKMKTNTQIVLKRTFENSVIPFFALKKLADITSLDVMEFQQYLIKKGLQSVTVNSRIAVLNMVFERAKELGFINSNPVKGIKTLREEKHDRSVLTEIEIIDLVNKIDHPYKYAIALGGLAGARVSEVLGFQWEDFELGDRGKISFKRQINMAHEVDELKSKASAATLPMLNALTKFMMEWKEKCPDSEWLFQGDFVDYVRKLRRVDNKLNYKYHRKLNLPKRFDFIIGTSVSDWWSKVRSRYSLEGMRFHDFRHSFATNAVTRCANIKTAQKLCRHSDIQTTLNIYAHVHPEQLEEVWDWDF